jgi:hypothetical protein
MAQQLADVDDPEWPVFVVVWEDGAVSVCGNTRISQILDLADCVKSIHAANQDGELVKITVGKSHEINTDEERPFRYAAAPIMAGTRRVGTAAYTDH